MREKNTVIALVPMRHHSERVPEKNYRPFNGKPLYSWILQTLCDCPSIESVYIDTDSPVIKKNAPAIHEKIHILDRPAHLRADDVPMNEIIAHDISQIDFEYFLQTHATNPLLKKETIERAIQTFFRSASHDSLFGVTRLQTRLWDGKGAPVNHNPDILQRTQDLAPLYEENSNLYIFSKASFSIRKNRIGAAPVLFEIPRLEALDIDEEADFQLAQIAHKGEIRKDE